MIYRGNKEYKDIYLNILDIRNGKAPRPFNYEYIYWDLLEPKKSQLHPLEKPISLKEAINKLPFSKYEIKKLKKSEKKSNALVNLEIEAFHAMEGLFKDANGLYTLQGKPNKNLAIELLHSKQYNKAKHKIMLPLDYFLMFLDERNKQKIDEIKEDIHRLFKYIYILMSISFFVIGTIVIIVYKKVLAPVSYFTDVITDYKQGKEVTKSIPHYKDEIGAMIEQFYIMKKKQEQAYDSMKELALTDSLTGIDNKRVFTEISEKVLLLSIRHEKDLSVLMLDIDYFKKVNDTYGHLIGDEILKHLVNTVKTTLRSSDIFARFGGEEFIILLSETDEATTLFKAEQIRKKIEKTPYIDASHDININISIGVAQKKDEINFKDLIVRADEALYMAKNNGRNQVQSK